MLLKKSDIEETRNLLKAFYLKYMIELIEEKSQICGFRIYWIFILFVFYHYWMRMAVNIHLYAFISKQTKAKI